MNDNAGRSTAEDLEMLGLVENMPPWEWPEGAGESLQRILLDRGVEESKRVLAAELAGDCVAVSDEIVEALLSVLGNSGEPEELRSRAAIALGPALEYADTDGLDDPEDMPISEEAFHRIRETLAALYADSSIPKLVRRRILEAAVRAPQEWQRDAVQAAYASGDEDWKLTAVFGMGFLSGFESQIVESIQDRNSEIRHEAVRAAGSREVAAAWPYVAPLLNKKTEKQLLLAAIEACPGINAEEAGPLLVNLVNSKDEEIAEAATEAMLVAQDVLEFQDSEDEDEDEEAAWDDEEDDEPPR